MATWSLEQLKNVAAHFVGATEKTTPKGRCAISASTRLPRVRFFWSTASTSRAPAMVDEGIVFLLSGQKRGVIGDRQFTYDPDHYLVVSASLPYEYSGVASEEAPLMGLFVSLDLAELKSLAEAMARHRPEAGHQSTAPGLAAVPFDEAMRDVVRRMLDLVLDPMGAEILGAALVREAVYQALRGSGGGGLWSLTQVDSAQTKIARLLVELKEDVGVRHQVEGLARRASMSVTTFHRAFRRFTGETPIQYLKKLRLQRALGLIAYDGLAIGEAAAQVGYESPTQFSREFKRLFGRTPSSFRSTLETTVQ